MERTDTSGIELKPKGMYILKIERVIKSSIGKEGQRQYPGYKWYFEIMQTDSGFETDSFDMFMFKSQMGELLRSLGCKEASEGVFEWELDEVKGKVIKAHMAHVDIKGKLREQLIEIAPNPATSGNTDNIKAWDE